MLSESERSIRAALSLMLALDEDFKVAPGLTRFLPAVLSGTLGGEAE